jgi:hypothetical protein
MRTMIFLLVLFQAALVSARGGPYPVTEKVRVLDLYYLSDGVLQKNSFTQKDLHSAEKLEIPGHVCGVVLFCDGEIEAKVAGREMNRITKNKDGTFSLKYFRTLKPEELSLSVVDKTYYQEMISRKENSSGGHPYILGGYSFFPRITGDAISSKRHFDITIEREGERLTIPVLQSASQLIHTVEGEVEGRTRKIAFRYIGTRLQELQEEEDFGERLNAVAEGVFSVEQHFNADLVRYINIVDYAGIHNAVTLDGQNDIWFYVKTFLEEPTEELQTISQHETLHIYVNQKKLPSVQALRGIFSDLNGFDLLSIERFSIMTSGVTPQRQGKGNQEIFFDFINEKNFLKGMKGGHSHDNVEEFLTSFLHTLMYSDRLEENLHLPLSLYSHNTGTRSRVLTPSERVSVLDRYIQVLEILKESLPDRTALTAWRASTSIFNGDLMMAKALRAQEGLSAKMMEE